MLNNDFVKKFHKALNDDRVAGEIHHQMDYNLFAIDNFGRHHHIFHSKEYKYLRKVDVDLCQKYILSFLKDFPLTCPARYSFNSLVKNKVI